MSKKVFVSVVLLAAFFFASAESASAKMRFVYPVKFVCGYNNTNVGVTGPLLNQAAGEPTVKFGNYATDINIYNFNIYGSPSGLEHTILEKSVILLVDRGVPVGREPRTVLPVYSETLNLPFNGATMDDCNRIAEMIWGFVPSPFPITIGFLVVGSTDAVDITAVYTAETCSNWLYSPVKLECLNPAGNQQGLGVSIDVRQITGHQVAD
ncbi:MAG TPA: hypothetical protein VLT87_23180 [Thermoanaerobaculia bacterium]|nr:hypothetical protein [Thermoanaerobaculia bacterium]